MRRFFILALVGGMVGGLGWFVDQRGFNGLEKLDLRSWLQRPVATEEEQHGAEQHAPLRIASFKVRGFHQSSLEDSRSRGVLLEVVRGFDVLTLQGLDSSASAVITGFVSLVNAGGRRYDFVLGPISGRNGRLRRSAVLFDTEKVDLDRGALYAVDDPDHLLAHPPLVAWFRARGVPTASALTFTLMVVDSKLSELEPLAAACRAVRDDGRGEDDLLVAGDFGGSNSDWAALAELARLAPAITGVPTNTVGDRQEANIYYSAAAVEFTGRAGVLDLVRQFNLTVDQALAISDHMPVWAEFARAERDADQFAANTRRQVNFGSECLPTEIGDRYGVAKRAMSRR
jgi:hypothetical protein